MKSIFTLLMFSLLCVCKGWAFGTDNGCKDRMTKKNLAECKAAMKSHKKWPVTEALPENPKAGTTNMPAVAPQATPAPAKK